MEQDLINYDKALQCIGGDAEFLFELLNDLVNQVNDNIEDLREAINSHNYNNLKTLSHNLKGVSANLNVSRLASHFIKLEELSSLERNEGALDLINLVSQETNALKKFINRNTL